MKKYVEGEVTRVEQVRYLEGASGHAVLSTAFLVLAGVLFVVGSVGVGALAVVVAYAVSLNGLSIWAWDRLRLHFESRFERGDDGPTRTLQPHRISAEMKAELTSGFVMVGLFAVGLTVVFVVIEQFSVRIVGYLSAGVLAVGNVGALGWKYLAER